MGKELNPFQITPKMCDLISETYGNGFGSRNCSSCMNLDLYLGQRTSEMASCSLAQGPGMASEFQYCQN